MKHIYVVPFFCLLLLMAATASAATPDGYPPAHGGLQAPPPLPVDYISPDAVKLTPQEKKRLWTFPGNGRAGT